MINTYDRTVIRTLHQKIAKEGAAKIAVAHCEIFRTRNFKIYFTSLLIRRDMKIMHRKPRIYRSKQPRRKDIQAIGFRIPLGNLFAYEPTEDAGLSSA